MGDMVHRLIRRNGNIFYKTQSDEMHIHAYKYEDDLTLVTNGYFYKQIPIKYGDFNKAIEYLIQHKTCGYVTFDFSETGIYDVFFGDARCIA